jgi:hypothetical protein
VTIESQSSRVYQSFGKSGFESQGDEFLNITIVKIAIREILERKEERLALTVFWVSGIQETNAWPTDSRKRKIQSPK